MWIIKGVSAWDSTGSGEKDFTIYAGTDALPNPSSSYGEKSDYFMLIKGNSTTYFVDPLVKLEYKNLSVTKVGNGVIVSKDGKINCGSICSGNFDNGSSVILTATPDTSSGSMFGGWSGACTNKTGDCTVKMSDTQTVTATFFAKPMSYRLSISKSGNGNVTSDPAAINCGTGTICQASFDENTTVILTATPKTGETFTSWGGCTPASSTPNQCRITLTGNKMVTATFSMKTTPFADVRIMAITITPKSPAANSNFIAVITTKNLGNTAMNGGYLDVWVDESAVQACKAAGDVWDEIGELAAGESKTLTIKLRSTGIGPKRLHTFVDSRCETRESNENNNQSATRYTVK
jgi:hypothetical protein